MMHDDTRIIEERLRSMEETHRRNAASSGRGLDACKSCYADYPDCLPSCGLQEWVPLPAAIIEARMLLEDAHNARHKAKRAGAQEVAA